MYQLGEERAGACWHRSGQPASSYTSVAVTRLGEWSLSRIGAADPAPAALAPTFPVPVVRPTAPTPGSDRWHLADQADILKLDDAANPSTRYGLVQTLGAQKV